jgi:hypothetical protein
MQRFKFSDFLKLQQNKNTAAIKLSIGIPHEMIMGFERVIGTYFDPVELIMNNDNSMAHLTQ